MISMNEFQYKSTTIQSVTIPFKKRRITVALFQEINVDQLESMLFVNLYRIIV